jgi:NAD(P)-dependent dehydrogenase (short-subunit alcohol dehydrogenase family)
MRLSPAAVKFFHTDITKLAEIERAIEETMAWTKETGATLGGVINCAGVGAAAKVSCCILY